MHLASRLVMQYVRGGALSSRNLCHGQAHLTFHSRKLPEIVLFSAL